MVRAPAGSWMVAMTRSRPPAMRRAEDEARVRALEALRFIEMDHLRDRLATELSYGQQRLGEIARALVRGSSSGTSPPRA